MHRITLSRPDMHGNQIIRVGSILFLFFFLQINCIAQDDVNQEDAAQLKRIYDEELTNGSAYMNLRSLCKDVGHRLSGSAEAEEAVLWAKAALEKIKPDTVYLQEVQVPHWVRGEQEMAELRFKGFVKELPVCALGGSVGTGKAGLQAEVVEVFSLEELKELGKEKIENKIVFFNRPMDPKHVLTFHAYGGCVDQRSRGAAEAAKYGAVAVIVRSMNLRLDNYPHAGAQHYADGVRPIPAAAVSTNGAELLSQALKEDPHARLLLKMNCQTLPDVTSHNVIAEIRGSVHPEEIILVGGHLDSWDMGEGAHDDGAGVVHAMEVLHLFKTLDIRPERTIRCVLFMNEENGLKGGYKYAEVAKEKGEIHLAAIESDAGGFVPRGFSVAGEEGIKARCLKTLESWKPLFKPYLVHYFEAGYGGADIRPLIDQGPALMGFMPDPQRYFDFHHTGADVFEAVNKRELELGAASIASLTYLISKHGFLDKE